jgi:hypothetical protein
MNVYGTACSEMLASPGSIAKRLKQFALLNYPFSFFRALLFSSMVVIGSGAIMIGVVVIESRAIAMVSSQPNNPFHFSFQGRLNRVRLTFSASDAAHVGWIQSELSGNASVKTSEKGSEVKWRCAKAAFDFCHHSCYFLPLTLSEAY